MVTNVPLGWGMLIVGGTIYTCGGMVYMGNLCVPLNSEPKTTLINSVKK